MAKQFFASVRCYRSRSRLVGMLGDDRRQAAASHLNHCIGDPAEQSRWPLGRRPPSRLKRHGRSLRFLFNPRHSTIERRPVAVSQTCGFSQRHNFNSGASASVITSGILLLVAGRTPLGISSSSSSSHFRRYRSTSRCSTCPSRRS